MPKHITRLLLLLGAALVVALVARTLLIPDSFYRFGHYRANSVIEVAAKEPRVRVRVPVEPLGPGADDVGHGIERRPDPPHAAAIEVDVRSGPSVAGNTAKIVHVGRMAVTR